MDAYNSLQSSNSQEDTLHRKIFEKIEESKRDRDPEKCQQILEDLMKILKHLTADVNNYNLAFRETRPPFYMQVKETASGREKQNLMTFECCHLSFVGIPAFN